MNFPEGPQEFSTRKYLESSGSVYRHLQLDTFPPSHCALTQVLSPQNEAPGHTRGEHPEEVSRDCMTKGGKRQSMKAELEVVNRRLKMFSLAMSPRNTQENKHTASSFCLVSGHSL